MLSCYYKHQLIKCDEENKKDFLKIYLLINAGENVYNIKSDFIIELKTSFIIDL